MIPEAIKAFLLTVPLIPLIIQSVSYWTDFKTVQESQRPVKKTRYFPVYFYLLGFGVLWMWVSWLGSIILLALGRAHSSLGFSSFSTWADIVIQISGLLVFYCGAITYNWSLLIAGKYLRPAPSGIYNDHKLVQEGPFGIVRHPLYVSYILIALGLSLALSAPWMLVGPICLIVGIYPTAKAEEETLVEQFGREYIEYQQNVGMLFPRLF